MDKLREAGGIVIKNNPFGLAWTYWSNGEYQRFFNRNHQKVMLVDDYIFCGSLNVADPYTGTRYGDSSFRDLNCYVRSPEARRVVKFFQDIIEKN